MQASPLVLECVTTAERTYNIIHDSSDEWILTKLGLNHVKFLEYFERRLKEAREGQRSYSLENSIDGFRNEAGLHGFKEAYEEKVRKVVTVFVRNRRLNHPVPQYEILDKIDLVLPSLLWVPCTPSDFLDEDSIHHLRLDENILTSLVEHETRMMIKTKVMVEPNPIDFLSLI